MADYIGRESAEHPGGLDCEQWEALLADKLDAMDAKDELDAKGAAAPLLDPAAEAAFVEHSRGCAGCGSQLKQARQGREWLKLLNANAPPTPSHLLTKILASTQGAGHEMDHPLGTTLPPPQAAFGWMLPGIAQRRLPDARLLMTAAMAFFSVALTLSLVGVRITSVHAAELRPQAVQANMTRTFYGTKKQVVSFYENLRLVYEVESKMKDLRRDVEPTPTPSPQPATAPAAQPQAAPAKPGNKPAAHGAASVHGNTGNTGSAGGDPIRGWPVAASCPRPGSGSGLRWGRSTLPAPQLRRTLSLMRRNSAVPTPATAFSAPQHPATGAISEERTSI